MAIDLDQSGKIETTNKDTIIAYAGNEGSFSVKITAKDKRAMFVFLERKYGRTRENIFRIFATTIAYLFVKSRKSWQDISIKIDMEYPGHEKDIERLIYEVGEKMKLDLKNSTIIFSQIGKRSKAHFLSYGIYTKKKKESFNFSVQDFYAFWH